jgi:predicted PurR-regulated permease PerM
MPTNRFYSVALIFLALVLGYFSYQVLSPFLSPIAWAIVLAVVFYPIYAFCLKYLKWKSIASVITIVLILLIILGPFSYLTYLFSQELIAFLNHVEGGKFDPLNTVLGHPLVNLLVVKVLSALHVSETDFQKAIIDNIARLGKESVGLIRSGLGNAVSAALDFVFMILSLFFFLGSGPEFLEKVGDYMPFSRRQKERLVHQTRDIVVSTIYGGITVAVVQGILGGIAFALLGISSPVIWGLAMFVSSFIPLVGTFLVWGPTAGYLMLQGEVLKGMILVAVGVVGISSVDNILRPLIIRGKMKMPTLVIFFSILGGIKLFGFIGFIMGPLVLALFISVVDILRYIDGAREDKKA